MDEELLSQLIDTNDGVLRTAEALTCMSENELRCRIAAGRWQRPCNGLVVPHSGSLSDKELLRVALERCGPRAVLAGLTAAKLDQALSELDFTRKVVRQFKLPEPSRQVGKRDSRGRRRWIDVVFEESKVMVEIDGAQHLRPLDQWDDMERDNDNGLDGYRVLRFPAWVVRDQPEYVARKILDALRRNGYRDGD